jgi:hypothetical protein
MKKKKEVTPPSPPPRYVEESSAPRVMHHTQCFSCAQPIIVDLADLAGHQQAPALCARCAAWVRETGAVPPHPGTPVLTL